MEALVQWSSWQISPRKCLVTRSMTTAWRTLVWCPPPCWWWQSDIINHVTIVTTLLRVCWQFGTVIINTWHLKTSPGKKFSRFVEDGWKCNSIIWDKGGLSVTHSIDMTLIDHSHTFQYSNFRFIVARQTSPTRILNVFLFHINSHEKDYLNRMNIVYINKIVLTTSDYIHCLKIFKYFLFWFKLFLFHTSRNFVIICLTFTQES